MKKFNSNRFDFFLNSLVEIASQAGRIRWALLIRRAQELQWKKFESSLDISGKQAQIMAHFQKSELIIMVDKNPEPVYLEGNHVFKYRFSTHGVYVESQRNKS